MNILTIDTSTGLELVAVSASGDSSDLTGPAAASHSVTLFERIDAALKGAGIGIRDIGLIGVGVGPGSFTGIRIAVTTARMLAQVLAVPLAGVHSQLIFAASAPSEPGDFLLSAFDAKKGRVFGALYRREADALTPAPIIPPGDYEIGTLLAGTVPGKRLIVTGYGIEKWEGIIETAVPGCEILRGFVPSGAIACALAERAFADNPGTCRDYASVVPRYARKSDAEVVLDMKGRAGETPAP